MAASAVEVHHRIPRCLLGFFDRSASGELDGAGLQAWFDWEEEAFRFGVNPDVSRGELVALIESSAIEISEEQHKASHIAAGDFARWAAAEAYARWPFMAGAGTSSSPTGVGSRLQQCN